METKVRVKVTRECIEAAKQGRRGVCPIALAVRLSNDDFGWPIIDRDKIAFSDRETGVRYTWKSTAAVKNFIDRFDLDKSSARPFTFTLDTEKAVDRRPMKRRAPLSTVGKRKSEDSKSSPVRNRYSTVRSQLVKPGEILHH